MRLLSDTYGQSLCRRAEVTQKKTNRSIDKTLTADKKKTEKKRRQNPKTLFFTSFPNLSLSLSSISNHGGAKTVRNRVRGRRE